jgi:hypothetical protein
MKSFSTTMKSFAKLICLALLTVITLPLNTDAQAPAQGPPAVTGSNVSELPIFFFRNYIRLYLKDSIMPAVQAMLDAESPVDVDVSFTLTPGKPTMGETQYIDQPNQKVVQIPYKIKYKLDGILNRYLNQQIVVLVSCDGWFAANGGKIKILLRADKPTLEGPSILEQALSFFVGGTLTNYLDNIIKSKLPEALNKSIPLAFLRTECNCLGVVSDVPPNYDNSWVNYQYKPVRNDLNLSLNNTISVTVKSIKRLPAKNYETNTILYEEHENITLTFFVNQQALSFTVNDITEGQERTLDDNKTILRKPGDSGSLILQATIYQANTGSDSRFLLFKKAQNFGNGLQKVIVQKVFWSKPFRLPNGNMSKPQKRLVDAYEISVDVKVQNWQLQH